MSDQRLFSVIYFGSGQMPPVATSLVDAWEAVWWVRDNYPFSPALQVTDRNHALFYLMSANIVNQVVDEVLGEDLLMPHGFPRNPEQSQLLSELAMAFAKDHSLRGVLREIVLSDAFSRTPPEDPKTDPYALPMLPYPEAAVSPAVTAPPIGADANSEGDYVHKVSPAGLLHQVHAALGWPRPPIRGDLVAYPTQALMAGIGRYASRDRGEGNQFGLDTFLAYEDGVATCRKPDAVWARDVHLAAGSTAAPSDRIGPEGWVDFIDLLADDAEANGTSWRGLALAIKDRLLADPGFLGHEEDLLVDLWGLKNTDSLDGSPMGDGTITPEEVDKLRDYCGMLLATPDFVLRGVRLAPPISGRYDDDPVCLPNEICSEADLLDAYTLEAERLGFAPLGGR